jgi:hypothetical protein
MNISKINEKVSIESKFPENSFGRYPENFFSSTLRTDEKMNCDFNDFLLSNSPVNLSPENSDQEDDECHLPSQAVGNLSSHSLLSGESLNFPSHETGSFHENDRRSSPENSFSSTIRSDKLKEDFDSVSVTPLNSSTISSEPNLEEKNGFDSNGTEDISSHKPQLTETINSFGGGFTESNFPTNTFYRSPENSFSSTLRPDEKMKNKKQKKKNFTRLTYENVEKNVSKYYLQNKTSNKFDVLITYLQSKKNIYVQSQNLLQIKLTIINAFTLFLTATVAIFAPFMYKYNWSSYFISAVNSMIAILIKLKDGFKYEANIENYNKLSNQFNNLETSMQLTSNKLQFIKNEDAKTKIIIEKIEYLEERLIDINNNFKMIFPEIIKKIFPIITHINIFTFIKKIESYKHHLIIDLQNVKNEIMYITHKWNMNENIILNIDVSLHDKFYTNSFGRFPENSFSCTLRPDEKMDSQCPPAFNPSNHHHYPQKNYPVVSENKNIYPSLLSNCDDINFFLKSSSKWDSIESIEEPTNSFGRSPEISFSSSLRYDEKRNDFLLNKQEKFLFINDKIRLQNLLKIKENIKIKLFHYKKIYEYIDEIFNEEIKKAESFSYWLYMIFIYKNNKNTKKDYDNPIVKELIKYAI